MRVPIYIWGLPFIYDGPHLYMRAPIYIWGSPFIYEGSHLYMMVLIYIWGLPFIYDGPHLYMRVPIYIWGLPFIYDGPHLYMRAPIYIWGLPFIYEGPHLYMRSLHLQSRRAGRAWVDHVILHVCNCAIVPWVHVVQAISATLASALSLLLQQSSTATATAKSTELPLGAWLDCAVAIAVEDYWSSGNRAPHRTPAKAVDIACTFIAISLSTAWLHTWSITWSTQVLPAPTL